MMRQQISHLRGIQWIFAYIHKRHFMPGSVQLCQRFFTTITIFQPVQNHKCPSSRLVFNHNDTLFACLSICQTSDENAREDSPTTQTTRQKRSMFQRMKFAALERRLTRAYKDRLAALGAVPKGVFWRTQSTQIARFDALLSIVRKISPVAHPAVADIGCGYGAMLEFIQKTPRYKTIRYSGYDINATMISSCIRQFADHKQLFSVGKCPPGAADFCLFSGTFNLCHTTNLDLWENYIFANLQDCWQRSRYGLVLNLLCAPKSHIKNHIFYADRQKFITRASRLFGPTHAVSTPHVAGDVTFTIAKQ